MPVIGEREQRVLRGLARCLGLPEEDNDAFECLRGAAEALGLEVADDGTTTLVRRPARWM